MNLQTQRPRLPKLEDYWQYNWKEPTIPMVRDLKWHLREMVNMYAGMEIMFDAMKLKFPERAHRHLDTQMGLCPIRDEMKKKLKLMSFIDFINEHPHYPHAREEFDKDPIGMSNYQVYKVELNWKNFPGAYIRFVGYRYKTVLIASPTLFGVITGTWSMYYGVPEKACEIMVRKLVAGG